MTKILFNWQDDDSTKDIDWANLGFNGPGRYFGFDADFVTPGGMTLRLKHSVTGCDFTSFDSPTFTVVRQGVLLTKQGMKILETLNIDLPISPGHATLPRIDIVVCESEYVDIAGASIPVYSVIQGTPSATPVAPALTAPTQIKIILGELYVPATTAALTDAGVIYTPSAAPNYASDPYIMKTNLVQTSTKEKTFSLLGYTPGNLAYNSNITNPAEPYIEPALGADPSNIWTLPFIDSTERYVRLILLAGYSASIHFDISKNKAGREHIIVFRQKVYFDSSSNVLFLAGRPQGNIHFEPGDVLRVIDITNLYADYTPGGGLTVPYYLALNAENITYRRENKMQKMLSTAMQTTSPTVVSNVLLLDRTGNYAEVSFGLGGADIKFLQDITTAVSGTYSFSTNGGTFVVLKILQPSGSNNIIFRHNATPDATNKTILNNSGVDITLNNGDMVFLVEGKSNWNVVSVFNATGNPFTSAAAIASLITYNTTTVTPFITAHTNETWRLLNTVGTMASGVAIPLYNVGCTNTGGALQVGRLRKVDSNYIHLQGQLTYVGLTAVIITANMFTLPVGYRPTANISQPMLFTDALGNSYEGKVTIGSTGVVAITAATGEITGPMGTVTWRFSLDWVLAID